MNAELNSPYEWLVEASRSWNVKRLRDEMLQLAENAGLDVVQNQFEREMDEDGFFDKPEPTEVKIRGAWKKLDHFYADDAQWEYLCVVILNEGFDGLRIGVGTDDKDPSTIADIIQGHDAAVYDRFAEADSDDGRGFHFYGFVKGWR